MVDRVKKSIFQGFCYAAGGGSETLLQAARQDLLLVFQLLDSSDALGFSVQLLFYCRDILQENLKIDRVSVPLLQTMAFLGDIGCFNKAKDNANVR
jgi:hypothetical protein